MIDLVGYESANALLPGEFAKLPPGGYVCKIINAEITKSKAGNPMLVLFVDIAEGDFANFFKAAADRVKNFNSQLKWDNSAVYRQSIFNSDGKVSSFFKGLITCFEKSNPAFKLNPRSFDEKKLCGLLIGFIFAEEEYINKRDGSIAVRTFIKFPKLVDDIRSGNFSVPDIKKLDTPVKPTNNNSDFAGSPIDPNDCPF